VEALLVALDMIQNHKHSKMWTLDIVLLTDGETAFEQDSFDVAMDLIDKLGVRLTLLWVVATLAAHN
jgi:ATP-dependent DNA helicase 2 subunit 2